MGGPLKIIAGLAQNQGFNGGVVGYGAYGLGEAEAPNQQ